MASLTRLGAILALSCSGCASAAWDSPANTPVPEPEVTPAGALSTGVSPGNAVSTRSVSQSPAEISTTHHT